MTNIILNQPRLTGTLCLIAAGSAFVYLGKRRLNRLCSRVSVTDLPKSSACRNLIESGKRTPEIPWGMDNSTVLSPWPGSDDNSSSKTHWISSFVALQSDIPISALTNYARTHKTDEPNGQAHDTHHLAQTLLAAFVNGRATGPETWLLDKREDLPRLSFSPGTPLFGDPKGVGAFLLGSWSSTRGIAIQPKALPFDSPRPVSEFSSNSEALDTRADAAGTVMYWKASDSLINAVDRAASYGLPWRSMQGGFQEYIVEKLSDETARVTYITIECTNLHPGSNGDAERDYKKLPRLIYELHVLYAQILLYKTLRQLEV
ncbi:uncharacterized protein BJX67DRAFT_379040 [Aspergillus lucknowensis]|uniref:Uncharacterized protein n=1 Tax=Aspergillus lucknowensis TaxID=176173 RepID=A0ABR4M1Q5_9EURO